MYLKIAAIVLASSLSGVALSQAPDAADVKIYDVIAGGNGCPDGSFTKIATNSRPGSDGADYFQITFDEFAIEFGKDIPSDKTNAICNMSFSVDWPEGYRFKIESMEFEGWADIHWLHDGIFTSKFSFFDSEEPLTYKKQLDGPFQGDYSGKQTKEKFDKFPSDCGGSTVANVETAVNLTGFDFYGHSKMGVDQSSGLFTQAIRLVWEKCD